jgi:hypothetical protein
MRDWILRLKRARNTLLLVRGIKKAIGIALKVSLAACVLLAGSKFLGLDIPPEWLLILIAAPIAGMVVVLARGYPLKDCAIYLDRYFGLEERISTAYGLSGKKVLNPIEGIQLRDAIKRFEGLDLSGLRRLNIKKEGLILIFTLPFLLLLALGPSVSHGLTRPDPLDRQDIQLEGQRLQQLLREFTYLPRISPKTKELLKKVHNLASLLVSGNYKLKELLSLILMLEEEISQRLGELKGAKDPQSLEAEILAHLRDQIAGAGAAITNQLKKGGIPQDIRRELMEYLKRGSPESRKGPQATVHPSDRPDPGELVHRTPEVDPDEAIRIRKTLLELFVARKWHPRYDEVIRRYYEGDKR